MNNNPHEVPNHSDILIAFHEGGPVKPHSGLLYQVPCGLDPVPSNRFRGHNSFPGGLVAATELISNSGCYSVNIKSNVRNV